ncbi:hypothetical protein [Butyrivibrio sp. FCS014]|uniref:hypothetical protein n=1 Tax=Butyrivibrio sp. FCS014 TaxID=1408304 RepID=UPI000464F4A2|nr:hypothetical protein [Butyrivibrio sp. FCS014]
MRRITVSEEGVSVLRDESKRLSEDLAGIRNETEKLSEFANENRDNLGPHGAEIAGCLEQIKRAMDKCEEPAGAISSTMELLADEFEQILN